MFSPSVYSEIITILPLSVRLVAVTKTKAINDIEAAYETGIRDFAESRIQEALPKIEALASYKDINWHFIGRLQRNKARKVVENFAYIHSIDNLAIAARLDRIAEELGKHPQGLLQVKLRPDENKSGWTKEALSIDLTQLELLQNLKICGLMTILPLGLSPGDRQQTFGELKNLAAEINQTSHLSLTELSMGMSEDYPQAIAAGATMIRLGTILFGDRG
ncbi:YggS family pyridoxal phosphate-dependent enzyme [Synechocystis sp. PCC 7339]|uniref:YggS family pyridoxal phosphate-dependent enzyme n=1 Tax=unclassified Synechocystis TaxID=2640012 RepID=UPI001BAE9A00|nr:MULTISPECIES: YggS family pyridoxal phosphate-dependent enzyme [unclassified Synechocystis]QUS62106.1 YggS family pyridoxal phosphate-dependent enzyme [Synechocystis sp. PCC 7338]UAJ71320.1 YggS family pyridoxal phosphate-dependent enzyme [Synechocystis sp. PCC 7339]